ncbi:P. aerophilum family 562 protein [Pyrobaculum aerophilum str. IM2]|uniref:P. aerophilum family 562 protein n=2 Tax=Pyrobaculum aerophilum TaxID=13773 RepID=Q8ZZM3_PYRAE|nr:MULTISPECIES: hypothetical protein [Pyrobaculum]AAL62616.1 P. aerophilum family 562 protein [Pyrobaculum aerophilum str. IM2]HII46671.1 hypothetical protein [Pyrobaculum aerophilum]
MKLLVILLGKCRTCGEEVEAVSKGDAKCPKCGGPVEFYGGKEVVKLLDCEIRDWERIAVLSPTAQQMVLQALESGTAPKELYPLLLKLKDAGALICT